MTFLKLLECLAHEIYDKYGITIHITLLTSGESIRGIHDGSVKFVIEGNNGQISIPISTLTDILQLIDTAERIDKSHISFLKLKTETESNSDT